MSFKKCEKLSIKLIMINLMSTEYNVTFLEKYKRTIIMIVIKLTEIF